MVTRSSRSGRSRRRGRIVDAIADGDSGENLQLRSCCSRRSRCICASVAIASDVQTDGKISVPQTAPVFAVCTDPVVQQTLEQDFRGAHRGPEDGFGAPVTVTVTVNEKLLKPGVVLARFRTRRSVGHREAAARGRRRSSTDRRHRQQAARSLRLGGAPAGSWSPTIRCGLSQLPGFRNAMMRPEGPQLSVPTATPATRRFTIARSSRAPRAAARRIR